VRRLAAAFLRVGLAPHALIICLYFANERLCKIRLHRCRCAEPIAAALARGIYKVTDGLAGGAVEKVTPAEWKPFDSDGCLFKNMNTPEDYAKARARFARE
jgi:hypothetical protein